MKELNEKIIEILEQNDINVCDISEHKGEYCAECETWSPAGEDVIITIWYDGTDNGFVNAFADYADNYYADEHAEMWVELRGKVRGVPSSIRALINDADAICEMLNRTATNLKEMKL